MKTKLLTNNKGQNFKVSEETHKEVIDIMNKKKLWRDSIIADLENLESNTFYLQLKNKSLLTFYRITKD